MSSLDWNLLSTGIVVFCGAIGVLAIVSPKAFSVVVSHGNRVLNMGREPSTEERWFDIDKYVLEHGRLFGTGVILTAAYLWWISHNGPDVYSKSILLPIVGIALVMGFLALRHIMWQQRMLERQVAEANRDPLTGLSNRRAFEFELKRRLVERQRRGRLLSIALIDIDEFKQINDVHGHLLGDAILEECAAAMSAAVDDKCVVSRIGGDEFAVLLGEQPLKQGSESAERIRVAIGEIRVPHEETLVSVTSSIGVAEADPDDDVTSLFKRADSALYAAKEAGRNRCYRQGGPEPATPSACIDP